MSRKVFEINPAEALTTGAVGEPGQRVFYIQARSPEDTVTLQVEKGQVQMLAQGIYQILVEINERYATPTEHLPAGMVELELRPPLDPEFRVERMELVYDSATDLVVLTAHELVEEDMDEDAASEARFCATRAQVHALADHAMEVAARGRPVCLLCGQPDDPKEGHICPKRNGHGSSPVMS